MYTFPRCMNSKSSEDAEMRQVKFDFPVDEYGCSAMDLDDQNEKNGDNGALLSDVESHSQTDDEMVLVPTCQDDQVVQANKAENYEKSTRSSIQTNTIIDQNTHSWVEQQLRSTLKQKLASQVSELADECTLKEAEIYVTKKFQEQGIKFNKIVKKREHSQEKLHVALQELANEKKNSKELEDDLALLEDKLESAKRRCTKLQISHREIERSFKRKQEEVEDGGELCKDQRAKLDDLEMSNTALAKSLEEARDEIFRLQPYLQDISVRQARIEYDRVCDSVQVWVEKTLDPIMDNDEVQAAVLENAHRHRRCTSTLIERLTECEKQAIEIPGTEPHVLIALIMRIVQEEILNEEFAGIDSEELRSVSIIERSMRALKPQRELSTISAWRSETYYATINSTEHQRNRKIRATKLARDLGDLMQVFAVNISPAEFCESIQRAIVEPAIELAEKLQISRDRFQFRQCTFDNMKQPHASCVRSLDVLDCSDLFEHGKRFDLEKFKTAPTHSELVGKLKYLCNMTPEMSWNSIQGDCVSRPEIVRKAKVLVAWGEPPDSADCTGNLFDELITIRDTPKGWLNIFRG